MLQVDAEPISFLLTDSRRIAFPASSLFFALGTTRKDGHDFITEVYERGVKCFVVHNDFDTSAFPNANFIFTENTLDALQKLAGWHRSHFTYPVIAITGSNGKTIVKEWLYQLLSPEYNITRSPRSYNSQIGVALSVWQMQPQHQLAIIEAGISRPGEMKRLEEMIRPDIGLLTNIGEAHSNGFSGIAEKIQEKLKLFANAETLLCSADDLHITYALDTHKARIVHWSFLTNAFVKIEAVQSGAMHTVITVLFNDKSFEITIEFTDAASIQNAIACLTVLLYLKIPIETIQERMRQLQPVNMRLQLQPGINNCSLINDSYSFDLNSFSVALDFLMQQHQHEQKTVIISDMPGTSDMQVYHDLAVMLHEKNVQRVIAIGEAWAEGNAVLKQYIDTVEHYFSTDAFMKKFSTNQFRSEAILLKGARVYKFEKIGRLLERKVHETVLEINLTALTHNLKQYQQILQPGVKLMAMVKAFGYGSGAGVANMLQFHKVDYLAVAYADEGVELRKAGIRLPIMVLNVHESAFENLVQFNLEPELFSMQVFKLFDDFLLSQGLQQYPVHIKLDTGMHRLGFEEDELHWLVNQLSGNVRMAVRSVFSHLVASRDAHKKEFTQKQADRFLSWSNMLEKGLQYKFIRHISNTAGVLANSTLQFDMVRLGIGLYGVYPEEITQLQLQTVGTLKTTIAQIRKVKAGQSVGYNQEGLLHRDSVIATIRIGYADGFRRDLSKGIGKVFVHGKIAPVVGIIAMDMAMIDITDVKDVQENDEVEIFGKNISVLDVAQACNTIPYEILTGVSQRVKRIYVEE